MFNQRKNKQFKYSSRFSKDENLQKPSKDKLKDDISSEWEHTRRTGSKNRKKATLPMLLLLLGAIIMVMYYLNLKLR